MRLSGVDPSIIRELSGIYKPFIKAFKELVSNAFDADAKQIDVGVAKDFSWVEVLDDGNGMTPWEFHQNFARLGGSTAWLSGGTSPGGRPRIGYKGIGFLAVARYCGELNVETRTKSAHRGEARIQRRNRRKIPWSEVVGDLVEPDILTGRTTAKAVHAMNGGAGVRLVLGRDYRNTPEGLELIVAAGKQLHIKYEVNCRDLVLNATLDFDYLLGLEHKADLRLLEDFCSVTIHSVDTPVRPYTRVRLNRLKEFVARELSAPPVKGKARNIAFKSGKEQFLWRLARSAPIRDVLPKSKNAAVAKLERLQATANLPQINVAWRDEPPVVLERQVYEPPPGATPLEELIIPVDIKENGLEVVGYLLARAEVVYPAELRGISVRVRNVTIGDASFFGWETLLSGPRKAAMSQISGELRVLKGLDAADAINPGRESFYEENIHYRTLRRHLFGSGESIGGQVGEGVKSILDRIRVRSQVLDKLTIAQERRRALADISSAVNFYAREKQAGKYDVGRFFATPLKANGLATVKDVPLRPGATIGGFEVQEAAGLRSEFEIDFKNKKVLVDFSQDAWSNSIYLSGHYYEVHLKQGKPEHPVCEFDNEKRRIYVNWTHPVKLQMDDVGFLKSAVLLRLAHHAAPDNADAMMDLAMNMLAFRAE